MADAGTSQRILGQQVQFTWSDSSSSKITESMAQVDTFQWRFNPDIIRYWPAGAKFQARQAVNAFFEVTMGGGQTDVGFADLVANHVAAVASGNKPPTISLTRTVFDTNSDKLFTQTFKSGILTSAGGDQADGNRALTQTITIEFASMERTGGSTGGTTGEASKVTG